MEKNSHSANKNYYYSHDPDALFNVLIGDNGYLKNEIDGGKIDVRMVDLNGNYPLNIVLYQMIRDSKENLENLYKNVVTLVENGADVNYLLYNYTPADLLFNLSASAEPPFNDLSDPVIRKTLDYLIDKGSRINPEKISPAAKSKAEKLLKDNILGRIEASSEKAKRIMLNRGYSEDAIYESIAKSKDQLIRKFIK